MATILTETWNQHAFPDDYPAKERVWAEESEHRRNETRRDIYLELSGSGLKLRRHTSDKADRKSRAAAKRRALDDMLLAVGSPAYQAAYNNELTFTIDGEDFEITQGRLYDLAKSRAEDLHQQIDAAKRRGASAGDAARLQNELNTTGRIAKNTDPRYGKIDKDRLQAVRDDLRQTPGLVDLIKAEGKSVDADATETQSAHMSHGTDSDSETRAKLTGWTDNPDRSSVADTVQDSPFAAIAVTPTKDFTVAASDAPAEDQPAPDTTKQTPGFNLG